MVTHGEETLSTCGEKDDLEKKRARLFRETRDRRPQKGDLNTCGKSKRKRKRPHSERGKGWIKFEKVTVVILGKKRLARRTQKKGS